MCMGLCVKPGGNPKQKERNNGKEKDITGKIQKEIDKLEAIHEKEEAIMEAINDLLEEEDE